MPLSTYADLKTAIATRTKRTDQAALIPDYVTLAEAEFNLRLRTGRMLVRDTVTISSDRTALPAAIGAVETLHLQDAAAPLQQATPQDLLRAQLQQPDSGEPARFAMDGRDIVVWPTPDRACTAVLSGFEAIPALSDAAPANWVLTHHPQLYLYGALVQFALHVEDDAVALKYQLLHDKALEAVNRMDRPGRMRGRMLTTELA